MRARAFAAWWCIEPGDFAAAYPRGGACGCRWSLDIDPGCNENTSGLVDTSYPAVDVEPKSPAAGRGAGARVKRAPHQAKLANESNTSRPRGAQRYRAEAATPGGQGAAMTSKKFHEIFALEVAAISRRRKKHGRPEIKLEEEYFERDGTPVMRPRPGANVVGLALSGGGIRSAAFCLGAMQALA